MDFIVEHILGAASYFFNMGMIISWLEVSMALNGSENSTHVGRFWLCSRCSNVFIVKVSSCRPILEMEPNWHFMPCLLIILNNSSPIMLL